MPLRLVRSAALRGVAAFETTLSHFEDEPLEQLYVVRQGKRVRFFHRVGKMGGSKAGGWRGVFSALACAQVCWRLIDGIREDFSILAASAVLLAHSPGISIRHLIPSLAKESSTAPPSSNGMSSRIIFVP
jgi:hypothetical protein